MSYTPPAHNAADFSWVGVAAYTPPAFNAANLQWAQGTPVARGFLATKFGTARVVSNAVLQATGFKTVHFGEHQGGSYLYIRPAGLKSVTFGQAIAKAQVTASAGGLLASKIGTPRSARIRTLQAQGIQSTAFGQHTSAVYLVGRPAGLSTTGIGTPKASAQAKLQPPGIKAIGFGSHSTKSAVRVQAPSLGVLSHIAAPHSKATSKVKARGAGAIAKVGRPVVRATYKLLAPSIGPLVKTKGPRAKAKTTAVVGGLKASKLGNPHGFAFFKAHGLKSVKFGAAIANWTHPARGVKVSQFGRHKALGGMRFLTLQTWGINVSGRIGQPAAQNRIPRKAHGLHVTKLGTPKLAQRYHVLHIPPQTQFGRPRAFRNPT